MAHTSAFTTTTTRRRGRPPVHHEAWDKVSVVLMRRQVQRLDGLRHAIHTHSGTLLTRAELIRAVLDGLEDSRLDLTAVTSGAVLRELIARKLRA
jgi:hypothetical protein